MTGDVSDLAPLNKDRTDSVVGYYEFKKSKEFNDYVLNITLKVALDIDGKLLYFLGASRVKSGFDSAAKSLLTPNSQVVSFLGLETGFSKNQLTDYLTGSRPHNAEAGFDSIESQEDDEINIDVQVLDKDGNVLSDEEEAYVFGEMSLPQSTFRNAGTGVNTRIVIIERHSNPEDAPGFPRNMNFSHAESPEQLFEMIRYAQVKPRKLRIDEQLDRYGLYMRTERSNYIFNGDGLNVDYIKKILTDYWFADVNEYGEVVMPYNKSVEIIKKIKEFESSQLAA